MAPRYRREKKKKAVQNIIEEKHSTIECMLKPDVCLIKR